MTNEQEKRFWNKISIPTNVISDCWQWLAGKTNGGYGMFRLNGKTVGAHRISYELVNGPIPTGMALDHRCHNRDCVSPHHLRVVTNRENQSNFKNKSKMSSTYTGVAWSKPVQKWHAQIRIDGKKKHLGYFVDELAASSAYQTALANLLV